MATSPRVRHLNCVKRGSEGAWSASASRWIWPGNLPRCRGRPLFSVASLSCMGPRWYPGASSFFLRWRVQFRNWNLFNWKRIKIPSVTAKRHWNEHRRRQDFPVRSPLKWCRDIGMNTWHEVKDVSETLSPEPPSSDNLKQKRAHKSLLPIYIWHFYYTAEDVKHLIKLQLR